MLNQTQQLLEKHKYAFDWKAEIQRAEQASEAATANPWDTVHKPTPMSAFCGTTVALGGLKLAEIYCRDVGLRWGFFTTDNSLLVIGAFGALSALAFGAPAAPLGRPMVTFQGFGLVVTLAMSLHYAGVLSEYYTGYGLPSELEEVLMPALGISAMLFFNLAIHPPAAACVISYATADPRQQWPTFLVAPVLIGCLYVHFVQLSVAHTLRFMRSIKVKPPPESEKGDVETGSADGKKAQTDGACPDAACPAQPQLQEPAGLEEGQRPRQALTATASEGWGAVKGKLGRPPWPRRRPTRQLPRPAPLPPRQIRRDGRRRMCDLEGRPRPRMVRRGRRAASGPDCEAASRRAKRWTWSDGSRPDFGADDTACIVTCACLRCVCVT